jgi:phosphatidate cytidylyltransferase
MKRILTAVVLIPIVLLLALRAPVIVLAPFIALVALLCIREFLDLVRHYGIEPLYGPVYGFTVLLFLALVLQPVTQPLLSTALMMYAVGFFGVVAPFLFLAFAMRRQDLRAAFPAAAAGAFAMVYIALPLALVLQIRLMWAGAFLVLYLLILVWVGDTAAYFAGRALGRHKLAPRISPGKTWEGTAASFLAAVAAGVWIFAYAPEINRALLNAGLIERAQGYFAPQLLSPWLVALLSGLINLAAQLGDLVESLIKRGAGVKDSGSLLPGHGGMLDRLDALLFAAPILWYYVALQVITQGHI